MGYDPEVVFLMETSRGTAFERACTFFLYHISMLDKVKTVNKNLQDCLSHREKRRIV